MIQLSTDKGYFTTLNCGFDEEYNPLMEYLDYAKRLKSLQVAQGIKTQIELSVWMGFSKSIVSAWMRGEKLPSMDTAIKISEKFGCSIEWLLTGKGQKELTQLSGVATVSPTGTIVLGGFDVWDDDTPLKDDEVALPFFREVELSAGSGRHQVVENHGRKLRFAKSTLRKSNVTIAKAACVTVSGNSMEPVLPNGCVVGIDTNNKYIVDGKPYAINYHGDLLVKRLYKIPGGGFRLNSFNSEYPDINCSADDSGIIIIGKVFWSSQLW